MANPNKPTRQHVLNKPPQKLGAIECHLPLLVAMSVVLPAEGYALAVEGQQAVIADGDAMRIPPEVAKHLRRSAECGFRVDNPIFLEERIDKSGKSLWILQFGDRSRKAQISARRYAMRNPSTNLARKTELSTVHGQEEVRISGESSFDGRGESARRNQAMDVRMQQQVLPPGVEDADEPNLRAESSAGRPRLRAWSRHWLEIAGRT